MISIFFPTDSSVARSSAAFSLAIICCRFSESSFIFCVYAYSISIFLSAVSFEYSTSRSDICFAIISDCFSFLPPSASSRSFNSAFFASSAFASFCALVVFSVSSSIFSRSIRSRSASPVIVPCASCINLIDAAIRVWIISSFAPFSNSSSESLWVSLSICRLISSSFSFAAIVSRYVFSAASALSLFPFSIAAAASAAFFASSAAFALAASSLSACARFCTFAVSCSIRDFDACHCSASLPVFLFHSSSSRFAACTSAENSPNTPLLLIELYFVSASRALLSEYFNCSSMPLNRFCSSCSKSLS